MHQPARVSRASGLVPGQGPRPVRRCSTALITSILSGCGLAGHICDKHEVSLVRLAFMMTLQSVMKIQPHAPPTALAHVLAVDDDSVIRQAIADYLAHHEFRVTAVADGPAMQAVLANEVVDLVVLDLKLQSEDGMALARRLREESAIPIIMLTGRRDEADRVMGLELGADDYLTKPFSPRDLLARIRAVLRLP